MVGQPTNGIAIARNHSAKMQLIPNPARDEVKISFDKLEGKALLKLTSITGQVIFSREINAVTGSVVIPLYNIPSGIYIAELQSSNTRFTEKLIKE
ncbi:MAG: T9SS type A sorting domain-containing protein [Anaerolineae bacterium]|nr:T9SS type A sorting domain-containing protein [Anaerolineae bacterium]